MRSAIVIAGIALVASLLAPVAGAQVMQPSFREVLLTAGVRHSLIEADTCAGPRGNEGQTVVGGGFRQYRDRRIGLALELSMARPCDRQAFTYYHPGAMALVQGLQSVQIGDSVGLYALFGGGVVSHRQLYRSSTYPKNRLVLAGGGGVRIALTKRLAAAPEFQVGHDGNLFTRFTVLAAVRLP